MRAGTALLNIAAFLLVFFSATSTVHALPEVVNSSDASTRKRVLILNSYHKGLLWTDNIVRGIESVLNPIENHIDLVVEYMDSKAIEYETPYKKILYDLYAYKYGRQTFDVIISSDDNALSFLREYHERLFPGAAIVFCGVNNTEVPDLVDPAVFTGLLEISAEKATLDLILDLHPRTRRIVVVADNTPSGNYRWTQLERVLPGYPDIEFVRIDGSYSLADIETAVGVLPDDAVVLFATMYRDVTGAYYTLAEGISRVSRVSARPLYGLHAQSLPYGIVGGRLLDGFYHGRRAGAIASRLLNGARPGDIPTETGCHAQYMFKYEELKRWGISISALPGGSRIIDQPVSLYEQNKALIREIVLSFGLLILALLGVAHGLVRSRQAARRLRFSEENLSITLDSIGDAVITTDVDGRINRMNPMAEELTGWLLEESRGKALSAVLHIVNALTRDVMENPVGKIIASGDIVGLSSHTVLISRSGAEFHIADSGAPIRDNRGKIIGVVMVFRDVTEEYRMQEKLRQSEERYRGVVEDTPVLVCCFKTGGEITFVNRPYCEYFGRKSEELVGASFLSLIPESERDAIMADLSSLTAESSIQAHEHRVIAPDGDIRWQYWINRALLDGDGKVCAYQSIGEDITDRKLVEQNVSESEMRFREILDSVNIIPVQGYDATRRVIYWNAASEQVYGYSSQEAQGCKLEDLIIPDSMREQVIAGVDEWLGGGKPIPQSELILRDKKGNPVPVYSSHLMHVTASGEREMFCIDVDLRPLRRMEDTLRRNEDRYRTLVENIPGVTYRCACDEHRTMEFFGNDVAELSGYPTAEFIGNRVRSYASIIHPEDRQMVEDAVMVAVSQKIPFTIEYRIVRADGKLRWVFEKGQGIFDDNGLLLYLDGVFIDITDRKLAEEEQQKRLDRVQRQQKALIELTMNEAVLDGDLESSISVITRLMAETLLVERVGVWLYNNKQSEIECIDQFGLSTESHDGGMVIKISDCPNYFQTQRHEWIVSADDAQNDPRTSELTDWYLKPLDITSLLDVVFRVEGKAVGIVSSEHVGRPRSWTDDEIAFARAVSDQLAQIFLTIQRKKTERQLAHHSKMDAIGQLAGGVAHDFNNMLGGIMGAAQLLRSSTPALDEEGSKYVEMILQAATRAADLTAKLLAFGCKGKIASTVVDVHRLIDDTVVILNRTVDKKIRISVKNAAENNTIVGDSSELQNALMNMGINASHAMPDGGEICIGTRNIRLGKAYSDASPFEIEPGEYIEIEVRDTGGGIPLENLKKIFEPFYTTKPQGKGTGLGLAAVYGTVQNHHGAINVYSEVGEGTSFHVLLPCTEEKSATTQVDVEVVGGSGQILLVDDEDLIRITGKLMLEEMGYQVILAENGRKALDIFQRKHAEIDLVIMDMIMPEMDGREAFIRMKEIDGSCKMVISSGFAKEESLNSLREAGLTGFIRKPYRDFELSRLLTEVLRI